MKNFELVIGIEIHLEINTNTKMYSAIKSEFSEEPNTLVSPIDLAYPGTLPTINKNSVIKAIKLAKALKMDIDNELHFDRKNYFYTDLPKGYQITQQFRPIAKDGKITLKMNDYEKEIRIERIHLEEDTARQQHNSENTLINYNRAGVPLIEIVSKPDIRTIEEAIKYIDSIRQIAVFLDISDAIMAKGSLRADVNLSVKLLGSEKFGTRVEIKNLNSFNNIKKAIDYEYNYQVSQIIAGHEIKQETKNFDESLLKNIPLRSKTDSIDYKYYPDPNIPVILLDREWIDSIEIEELPEEMRNRYLSLGVPENFCDQVVNNIQYSKFIDKIEFHDVNQNVKIFFSEIVPLEKKYNKDINNILINPIDVGYCLSLLEKGNISGKQLKQIIPLLVDLKISVDELIEKNGFKLISDENIIISWINEVKSNNENLLIDYKEKEDRTIKFVAGEIMKLSKGQANPIVTMNLIKKILGDN
ncbi:MAG: Asp-tRNA(Asn)/Glu-tRNA(Gln) amidotransferase subunit GatB [Mycoplasma sp.]|nr:Asp-tRNA(Asn)/Glu-tRNA(Gln) amidotransferase subunit GatB [Mycoplasma sp.]